MKVGGSQFADRDGVPLETPVPMLQGVKFLKLICALYRFMVVTDEKGQQDEQLCPHQDHG